MINPSPLLSFSFFSLLPSSKGRAAERDEREKKRGGEGKIEARGQKKKESRALLRAHSNHHSHRPSPRGEQAICVSARLQDGSPSQQQMANIALIHSGQTRDAMMGVCVWGGGGGGLYFQDTMCSPFSSFTTETHHHTLNKHRPASGRRLVQVQMQESSH